MPPSAAPPTGSFDDLYAAQFGRIAAQLYAYLGDHAEAQDLTQEAFVRTLPRWSAVSRYDDPAAFVRRVAWNLATSRLRRRRVASRYLVRQRIEHEPEVSPDRLALVAALTTLTPNHRMALVLHHLAHLPTAEIAQLRGVAEGTVRSWLSRGRAELQAYLRANPEVNSHV